MTENAEQAERIPRNHNLTVSVDTITQLRGGDKTIEVGARQFSRGDTVTLYEAVRDDGNRPSHTGNVWKANIESMLCEAGSRVAFLGLSGLELAHSKG